MSELEQLCNTEDLTTDVRGQCAMTLSECYSVVFGGSRDRHKIIQWLGRAASLCDSKARKWYARVCNAFGLSVDDESFHLPSVFEEALSTLPTEQYLISRMRAMNIGSREDSEQTFGPFAQTHRESLTSHPFSMAIFNHWTVDNLSELHAASWIGDDFRVEYLLRSTPVDLQSTQGLTALHYAYFGGNLSTVRLLLSRDASPAASALFEITPLHLCMHFSEAELHLAVKELLNHGRLLIAYSQTRLVFREN